MYQHGHALPRKLENNGHGLEFLLYPILSPVSALDTNKNYQPNKHKVHDCRSKEYHTLLCYWF